MPPALGILLVLAAFGWLIYTSVTLVKVTTRAPPPSPPPGKKTSDEGSKTNLEAP